MFFNDSASAGTMNCNLGLTPSGTSVFLIFRSLQNTQLDDSSVPLSFNFPFFCHHLFYLMHDSLHLLSCQRWSQIVSTGQILHFSCLSFAGLSKSKSSRNSMYYRLEISH